MPLRYFSDAFKPFKSWVETKRFSAVALPSIALALTQREGAIFSMLVDEDERPLGAHRNQGSSPAHRHSADPMYYYTNRLVQWESIGGNILSRSQAFQTYFSRCKANWRAGGDIWGGLSFMKKAFSQNGRRNIAVVVDLLFHNESLCAITTLRSTQLNWKFTVAFNGWIYRRI